MAGTTSGELVERLESGSGKPLILTEDPVLLDDLLRLCAAAGAEPHVSHAVPEQSETADSAGVGVVSGISGISASSGAVGVSGPLGVGPPGGAGWTDAPLVLVGEDVAGRVRGAPRRSAVFLVGRAEGRDRDDPVVWQRAVEIGAEQVLWLPEMEKWLVDRIADVVEGAGRPALTVGVIGGSGGAGASTLACALAISAARSGERTMLIDGDPFGGGLDVLLGGEGAEGLRWPDFAASRGRVAAGALEESLPRLHSLRLLSWDRGKRVQVPPAAMRSVLAAARRRGGVVVADLPRRVDEVMAEALAQMDLVLMVVPVELRSVAAASRVADALEGAARDVRVVVRARLEGELDPDEVAGLLRLPLAGEMPVELGVSEWLARGEPPGTFVWGPLARFCDGFWRRALGAGQGVPA
ncbi:septum site-determining protein Ssd [Streptomyces sp. NPDC048603]|uniref:septum site-determining protein Ssd n=1 Tax=Streptomyces sp. NPDC048603 TaxID=3365577 RepID=UPI00371558A3